MRPAAGSIRSPLCLLADMTRAREVCQQPRQPHVSYKGPIERQGGSSRANVLSGSRGQLGSPGPTDHG